LPSSVLPVAKELKQKWGNRFEFIRTTFSQMNIAVRESLGGEVTWNSRKDRFKKERNEPLVPLVDGHNIIIVLIADKK
jgi:hypothetical protein